MRSLALAPENTGYPAVPARIMAGALTPLFEPQSTEGPTEWLYSTLRGGGRALAVVLSEVFTTAGDTGLVAVESALAARLEQVLGDRSSPHCELWVDLMRLLTRIDAQRIAMDEAVGGPDELRSSIKSGFARMATEFDSRLSENLRLQLITDAEYWAANERDRSLLYRGTRLDQIDHHRWTVWKEDEDRFPPPGVTAVAFLKASVDARARDNRLRKAIAGGTAGLLMLFTVGIVTLLVSRDAIEAQRDGAYSRELAEASLAAGETDGETARMLAAAAWALDPTAEAATALRQAAANNRAGVVVEAVADLREVAFSPDGRFLVGVAESSVTVWDAENWEQLDVLPWQPYSTFSDESAIAFDRKSNLLAVATPDGVEFWDLEQRTQHDMGSVFVQSYRRMALSADGSLIAVASGGTTDKVYVFETASGIAVDTYEFPAPVAALAFDPRQSRLWVGLETWPGDEVENMWFLDVEEGEVQSASFSTHPTAFDPSAEGDWVAVSLAGGYTAASPLTEENEARILPNLASPSAFLPDGYTVMGATPDGAVGVWDLESARQIGTLSLGHCIEPSCPIAISPDGETVLRFTGATGTAFDAERIDWTYSAPDAWNDTGFDQFKAGATVPGSGDIVAAHSNGVYRWKTGDDGAVENPTSPEVLSERASDVIAVSPDGSALAIGDTAEPDVTVIDLDRPEEPRTLETGGFTSFLTFDDSGTRLAIAVGADDEGSESSRIELWDTATWKREATEPIETGNFPTWAMCITPDGERLVFSGAEQASLVDIDTGETLATLNSSAYNLACASNETIVGQSYKQLWRWSPGSGEGEILAEATMDDHSTGTLLAVSPDGRYIATAEYDSSTWLWDAEQGIILRTFSGYGSGYGISFTPDGDALVAFGAYLSVWDLSYLEDPYTVVCEQIDRQLTPQEWEEYAPDLPSGSVRSCA